jgi:hypothetical protein
MTEFHTLTLDEFDECLADMTHTQRCELLEAVRDSDSRELGARLMQVFREYDFGEPATDEHKRADDRERAADIRSAA